MRTDAGYAVELVIISAFFESLIFCSTLKPFFLWNKNTMSAGNLIHIWHTIL